MPDWRAQVREGEFVAVAVPKGNDSSYGYARVEASPIPADKKLLVTLYTETSPNGQRGYIPSALLLVPITQGQFLVARGSGWPGSYDRGRAICNQTTLNIGKA